MARSLSGIWPPIARHFNYSLDDASSAVFEGENLREAFYSFGRWHIRLEDYYVQPLAVDGFAFDMHMDTPIEVPYAPIDVSRDRLSRFSGVKLAGDALVFDAVLDNKGQEELIKALKVAWPGNKQRVWANELKMKLHAAFANASTESRRCLMLPWKYLLPDNMEGANQLMWTIRDSRLWQMKTSLDLRI